MAELAQFEVISLQVLLLLTIFPSLQGEIVRALFAFLILFSCSISFADSCTFKRINSVETLSCDSLEATMIVEPSGLIQMNLIFDDQFQMTLEVIMDGISQTASLFNFNDKRQLPLLSQEEVLKISKLAEQIKNNSYFSHPELIRFFKLLPANANLISLRDVARNTMIRKNVNENYIGLCQFIGLYRRGFYNIDGDTTIYSKKVTVGEHKSNCYGRCGSGCNDDSPSYTQQCLNHDICHRTTGENLGVCSDEFWLAAPGYIWAPLCALQL